MERRCRYFWCFLIFGEDNSDDSGGEDEEIYNPYRINIDSKNEDIMGNAYIEFDFPSHEDSVEEDEYYDNYVDGGGGGGGRRDRWKMNDDDDTRLPIVYKMLDIARKEANQHRLSMTPDIMFNISVCYDEAILATSSHNQYNSLKRKIIREYDLVKNAFPTLSPSEDTLTALLVSARNNENEPSIRKANYRQAIKLTVNIKNKSRLKKEYNQFLFLLRASKDISDGSRDL